MSKINWPNNEKATFVLQQEKSAVIDKHEEPTARTVTVDLRDIEQLTAHIRRMIDDYASRNRYALLRHIVVDLRSYVTLYRYGAAHVGFGVNGPIEILCGHMTSEEPTVILVSASWEITLKEMAAELQKSHTSVTTETHNQQKPELIHVSVTDVLDIIRNVIGHPEARICKHHVAETLLDLLERYGVQNLLPLITQVSLCNDEEALVLIAQMVKGDGK